MNTNTCSHWACNKADNTCVGCGAIICPICLKEPVNCKCENKDICCTSWSHTIIFISANGKGAWSLSWWTVINFSSITLLIIHSQITKLQTGSKWDFEWKSIEGPLKGKQLLRYLLMKAIGSNGLLCTRIQNYNYSCEQNLG